MKPFSRWGKISNLTLRINVFDKNAMQTLLTLTNHPRASQLPPVVRAEEFTPRRLCWLERPGS